MVKSRKSTSLADFSMTDTIVKACFSARSAGVGCKYGGMYPIGMCPMSWRK